MRVKVFRRGVLVAVVTPDFLGLRSVKYYPWQDLGIETIFAHEKSVESMFFT